MFAQLLEIELTARTICGGRGRRVSRPMACLFQKFEFANVGRRPVGGRIKRGRFCISCLTEVDVKIVFAPGASLLQSHVLPRARPSRVGSCP